MANNVQLHGFENCCGIYILNNFFRNKPKIFGELGFTKYEGYRDQEHVDTSYNKEYGMNEPDVDQWKARIRKQIKQQTDMYLNKKSYLLAVLNKDEAELHDVFIEEGWEVLVPETRNPTGTSITMYIYHLLPKQVKPTESILKRTA